MTDSPPLHSSPNKLSPGRLVYSSWFGDLGGGELRMLDHLRATAFDPAATTVLLNQHGPLERELDQLGVATRVIRWHAGSSYIARQYFWYSSRVSTWLMLRRLKPDVVVCNTFFDLETTGRVAARLGLRLIWRARGDTFPSAPTWPPGRLERLVAFLNRSVNRILATTEYEARMMTDAGVAAGRVFVVRNGVDLEKYQNEAAGRELRAGLGLRDDDFVIGCVARMVPQKGYETFFDALAILGRMGVRAHAIVAGDTTLSEETMEVYKRSLYARVQANGLADQVKFLGFRDDIWAVMNASDVFVLASLKEPFGTTIIEAMAAARPVIASDLAGPRESIHENKTGIFFPPGDADALARCLLEMQEVTSPTRRAFGQAGRTRVAADFNLTKNVADLDRHCIVVATGA